MRSLKFGHFTFDWGIRGFKRALSWSWTDSGRLVVFLTSFQSGCNSTPTDIFGWNEVISRFDVVSYKARTFEISCLENYDFLSKRYFKLCGNRLGMYSKNNCKSPYKLGYFRFWNFVKFEKMIPEGGQARRCTSWPGHFFSKFLYKLIDTGTCYSYARGTLRPQLLSDTFDFKLLEGTLSRSLPERKSFTGLSPSRSLKAT